MLQAILQVMLQGAGPVGYYLRVVKGVVSAGCCACGAFCCWILVPGSSFLNAVLARRFAPCSWTFYFWILVPGIRALGVRASSVRISGHSP
jgi:hypothetical protein